ncbi:MAG: PAS domain S-box protein [Acidobacteriota bacterium]
MTVSPAKRVPGYLLWTFAGLSALLIVGGLVYIDQQRKAFRWQKQQELAAVADLKVLQIGKWRKERLGDAHYILRSAPVSRHICSLIEGRSPAAARSETLAWMKAMFDNGNYRRMLLVDNLGRSVLTVPDSEESPSLPPADALAMALDSKQVVFSDLYKSGSQSVSLNLVIPIVSQSSGKACAAMLLEIDPEEFLYPFLRSWYGFSTSGETLLVRRQGDQVVFLHDLRFRRDPSLSLRLSALDPKLPAAMAARGQEGWIEGIDYRGTPVLALVRSVPNSTWSLVAKVDLDEIYAPLRHQAWMVVILILMAMAAGGFVLAVWWRREQAAHFSRLYESEVQRRALSEHFATFFRHAGDIILLLDRDLRLVDVNDQAIAVYGYLREELLTMRLAELRDPETLAAMETQLADVQLTGYGLYETIHRTRSGRCFPVEVSARRIEIDHDIYYQNIIRDISDRKLAQQRIEQLNRVYAVLSNTNQAIIRLHDQQQLLEQACLIAAKEGGFRLAWIGFVDLTQESIQVVASAGPASGFLESLDLKLNGSPVERGPAERALREGTYIICNTVAAARGSQPWQQEALRRGLRACAAFPLRVAGRACGVFTLYHARENAFDPDEVRLLNELADDLSHALTTFDLEIQRKRAQALFETAFASSPIPIVISTVPEGRYLNANNAFLETVGYSRDQVIGRTALDLGLWADPSDRRPLIMQAVSSRRFANLEVNLRTASGEIRTFLVSGERIEVGTQEAVLAVLNDITERKEWESTLVQSEARLQRSQQVARIVEWTWHVFENRLSLNGEVLHVLGMKPEDLSGDLAEVVRKVVHPQDQDGVLQAARSVLETKKAVSLECRIIRPDGHLLWIWLQADDPELDGAGEAVRLSGVCQDITDRVERERALETAIRQEEQTLSLMDALLASAPIGFAFVNRTLQCVRVNETLAAMNDLPAADPIGCRLGEVMPRLWPTLEPLCKDVLEKGQRVINVEMAVQSESTAGKVGCWLVSCFPVHSRGELLGMGIVVSDVTEQKRLEEQFRQAQKMEAIGRLAGGVAHDFNNLLTAILGYSELLQARFTPDDPVGLDLAEISKAGQRATALTRQLLAFSRQQVLQPVTLSLNDTVSGIERMLCRLIGEDIELVTALDPAVGVILADPGQIEQVILNLVVNARDAMPKGGRLLLEVTNADLDQDYALGHRPLKAGSYVMLAISDNGVGMDREIQARIFEPFFTTKGQGKGTGLGLSTVYGIVKQSDGYIWVYSEPGRGTTFKIYFPRIPSEPSPATHRVPEGLKQESAPGTETILVVEDDESVRKLITDSLRKYGYQLLVADNGATALMVCEHHKGAIDLMITDMVMPQMTGRELADRLGPFRPTMKLLFMSGYTDNLTLRHEVLEAGRPFLQKPFTPAQLGRKVRKVLDDEVPNLPAYPSA